MRPWEVVFLIAVAYLGGAAIVALGLKIAEWIAL